jgi:hypothetical protein
MIEYNLYIESPGYAKALQRIQSLVLKKQKMILIGESRSMRCPKQTTGNGGFDGLGKYSKGGTYKQRNGLTEDELHTPVSTHLMIFV